MKKTEPIRVGIVGCGGIMRSTYTDTFLSLTDVIHVAALCDLSAEALRDRAKHFPEAATFSDIDAMLRESKLDAVIVLTSEKANARMATIVLQAELPVYLEKPPATSSTELEALITAETQSKSFIYTAFNRRHTPLLAGLHFGKIVRVSGALRRENRIVKTFPHTAIHLIDSAQHFGGGSFEGWKIRFETAPEFSRWSIDGRLTNGAEVTLELVPNGGDFTEFLIIESDAGKWELHFPNTSAEIPEGEVIGPAETIRGEKAMPSVEAMGFRPSLLAFVKELKDTDFDSPHRLPKSRATIRLIEEMEATFSI